MMWKQRRKLPTIIVRMRRACFPHVYISWRRLQTTFCSRYQRGRAQNEQCTGRRWLVPTGTGRESSQCPSRKVTVVTSEYSPKTERTNNSVFDSRTYKPDPLEHPKRKAYVCMSSNRRSLRLNTRGGARPPLSMKGSVALHEFSVRPGWDDHQNNAPLSCELMHSPDPDILWPSDTNTLHSLNMLLFSHWSAKHLGEI